METGLTPKQKQLLEFIEGFLRTRKTMPSRREIASGLGLSSPATIQQHIEALEKKGYLKRGTGRESRALLWTPRSKRLFSSPPETYSPLPAPAKDFLRDELEGLIEIPLLGNIAAGQPIEVYPDPELQRVPSALFSGSGAGPRPRDLFMLKVRGDSMIDDGILPDDRVILRRTAQARSGETVAALLNGEATLKRLYKNRGALELHPANPKYPVIPVKESDRFEIQGVLVALLRNYP